jgi:VWFA-related protein
MAALFFLLVGLGLAGAAQDKPAFRSGVQIVEVDARVFDRERRFVTDLTVDDFELLEDGVPQPLQAVYLVGDAGEAGLKSRPTPETAPDAGLKSRATPDAAPAPKSRQTWIFFFDLNHLPPGGGFGRAREAVEEFLRKRFQEGDLGGVIAGSKMVNNRLTTVREELANAVKGIKPLGDARSRQLDMTREWPRFTDAAEVLLCANENKDAIQRVIARACSQEPETCKGFPPDLAVNGKSRRLQRDFERTARDTMRTIDGLASGLAKIPGPKTIVFLSDGFLVDEVTTTLQAVVGQVARAGARVYAIDVRGFRGAGPDVDQMIADDPFSGPARFDMAADGPNSLAVDTGGVMIRNQNNIGRAMEAIAADANRYYVLAYQPLNTAFDGKYRPIQVRVKRSGVVVRARRGYLALEPSKMLIPR